MVETAQALSQTPSDKQQYSICVLSESNPTINRPASGRKLLPKNPNVVNALKDMHTSMSLETAIGSQSY